MIHGQKILVTGASGKVAEPVAKAFAEHNEVWGLARFNDDVARKRLEEAGVRCHPVDLLTADFSAVPTDFDYVLNFAVSYSSAVDFDHDLSINAESAGLLMAHCRAAKAFLHCSSTAIYADSGRAPRPETHPLADFMRPSGPTYSITKIAAEAVVRTFARHLNLPTTIARLNVPYGERGGWPAYHMECILSGNPVPVHPDTPSVFKLIHDRDIFRTIPVLLEAAAIPATIVNWGGSEEVSIEDWSAYVGELVGKPVSFVYDERCISSVVPDTDKLEGLLGEPISSITWKDGLRQVVVATHPEVKLQR